MKNYKFIVPCVIIAFLMGLLVMSGISRISASPARTQAANIREKRIVSVMVEENDSIWSIAKRYYTEEFHHYRHHLRRPSIDPACLGIRCGASGFRKESVIPPVFLQHSQ